MVSLKELFEQIKTGGSNSLSSAADQLLWVAAWSAPEPSLEKWAELHDCSGSWLLRAYLCTPTMAIPYRLEVRDGYLQFYKNADKPTKEKVKTSNNKNPSGILLSFVPSLLVYSAYMWVSPSWFLFPFLFWLPNSLWALPLCFLYQRMGVAGLILPQIISVFHSLAIGAKKRASVDFLRQVVQEGSSAFLLSEFAAQLPLDMQHGLFVSYVASELTNNPGGKSLIVLVSQRIKKYGIQCVFADVTPSIRTQLGLSPQCKKTILALAAANSTAPLHQFLKDVFRQIVLESSPVLDSDTGSQLSQEMIHGLFVSHVASELSSHPGGQTLIDLVSQHINKFGIQCVTAEVASSVLNRLILPIRCKMSILSMALDSMSNSLLCLFLKAGVDPSLSGWTQQVLGRLWSENWQSYGNIPPSHVTFQELSLVHLCLESGFPPKRPLVCDLQDFRTFDAMYRFSQTDVTGYELAAAPNFPSVLSAMISSGWDANARGCRLLSMTTVKSDWKTFKLLIHNGLRAHEATELDSKNMLLAWDGSVMQDRNFWRLVLECEDLYDEFMKSWSPRSISLWMGISSTSVVFDAVIHASRQQNRNPLELAFLLGNGRAVQQLSMHCGFGETSKYITELLSNHPRINLGWAWSQLYEIDPKYFSRYRNQFKAAATASEVPGAAFTCEDIANEWPVFKRLASNVQCALMPFILVRLQPPPFPDTDLKRVLIQSYVEGINVRDLNCLHTDLFNKINFRNSKEPAFKGEASRRFDGSVYPVEQLRGGIKRIVNVIINREVDVASPNPERAEEFERYYAELEVYLRMVASELCAPTSAADKCATTLIYMGYCGLFCTDKWREMIHQVLCDLTDMADGGSESLSSLSDRCAVLASNLRGMIAQDLSQKVNNVAPHNSTSVHYYHHYMYLMQDERAIYTGPFYTTPDKFCGKSFPPKEELTCEFDRHYTLERLYSELVIHYRALGQLRDLIHDWVRESMAERWNDPPFNKWGDALHRLQADNKLKSYDDILGDGATEEQRRNFLDEKSKLLVTVFGQTASEQDAQVARLPSCEGLTAIDLVRGINGRYVGTRAEGNGLKSIPPATFLAEVKREELSEITRPEELQYNIHPLVLLELLRSVGLVRYRTSAVFHGSFRF